MVLVVVPLVVTLVVRVVVVVVVAVAVAVAVAAAALSTVQGAGVDTAEGNADHICSWWLHAVTDPG